MSSLSPESQSQNEPKEDKGLSEDMVPTEGTMRIMSEDMLPGGEGHLYEIKKFDPEEHKAATRKTLTLTAFGVLALFHAAPLTLLACGLISVDDLAGIIAAFSGIQTLAAVAFAFYFAKS